MRAITITVKCGSPSSHSFSKYYLKKITNANDDCVLKEYSVFIIVERFVSSKNVTNLANYVKFKKSI